MKIAYPYVRWSSEKQSLGDTARRQLDNAAKYAAQHGLVLSDERFTDSGVSAFKGKNAAEGALKAFLDAVDAGRIQRGSYLLVESLDRLSRQKTLTALELFTGIINRGITVVSMLDHQEYSVESVNNNWTQLIVSLGVMARGHDESATKSKRVKEAWDEKRRSGAILTSNAPPWLQLGQDKKWHVVKEQADKVKLIFKLALKELGTPTIAKMLNEKKVTPFRAERWTNGTVAHVLTNPAVIGMYVSKKVGGPPVERYFPAVIEPEVFATVQSGLEARRWKGGNQEQGVTNLFTGLCYCHCGARMKFVSSSKPNYYLRCSTAYSDPSACTGERHPYREVRSSGLERSLLIWFHLDAEATYDHVRAKSGASDKAVLEGQLRLRQVQLDTMVELMKAGSKRGAHEVVKLEAEIDVLTEQLRVHVVPSFQSALDLFNESFLYMQQMNREKDAEKRTEMRRVIRGSLQRMVEKVVFFDGVETRDDDVYGKSVDFRSVTVQLKGAEPVRISYPLPKWGFGRKRS